MSEAKHTPGPWEVSPKDPCRVNVAMNTFLHPDEPRVATADEQDDDDFHDDWNICQADDDHYSRPHDECVANALLIAACPDMLAELRETADWLTERAELLRKLAENGGAFRLHPTGVGMRQAIRDEAARLEGRATVIRQTILKATQGA